MNTDSTAAHCAAIYNLAWWVRHYGRPAMRGQRRRALAQLGARVRLAFSQTEDFEPLLHAVADGLAGVWPPGA
jgi:hypothetical protein